MVDKSVTDAKAGVTEALHDLAAKPSVAIEPSAVPAVTAAVMKETTAVLEHATNNEPWYLSRVSWGAVGAIVLPILGFAGVTADIIDADQFAAMGVAAGTVLSGLLTLYGRWVARKPIGQ